MKKYLSKALEEYNTIIIPGFGALTITSERTKDIYFIPYLKHNDGTLNSIICEITGNDKEISNNIIYEFVNEMEKSLENSKLYEINEFGRFKKLTTGDIEFEKWEEYNKEIIIKTKKLINKTDKKNSLNPKKENNSTLNTEKVESNKEKQVDLIDFEKNENKKNNLDQLLKKEEEKINIPKTYDNQKNELTNNEIIIDLNENIKLDNSENQNLDFINKLILEKNEINDKITTNFTKEKDSNKHQVKIDDFEIENKQKLKSKRKSKNNNHPINNIDEKEVNNKKEKKKKNKILPWILIGVVLTSGLIAYTLYSRKNEKILISEKIIDSRNETKKEIKTEVIKLDNNKKKNEQKLNISNSLKNKSKIKTTHTKTNLKETKKTKSTPKILNNNNKLNKIENNKLLKQPILTKKINTKSRPSKKELAQTDEIVNQLNSNKKNTEVVNTIKNNLFIKNQNLNNSKQNSTQLQNENTQSNSETNIDNSKAGKLLNNRSINTNDEKSNIQKDGNNKTVNEKIDFTTNKSINKQINSKSKTNTTSNNKKIELIADSFKEKSSAEKLVSKLQEGGYKNTRIEEKDGQYNVIIDSYNTLSETIKELNKYRGK